MKGNDFACNVLSFVETIFTQKEKKMQKVFKHSLANGDGVKLLKNAENCLKQGLVYGAQCRYHEANEYLNKSVKLFKRHGKPAPVKLRNAYNAIGILQFTKGKISQAQISLEYALGLCEVDSKNGYGHDGFLDIGGLLNDSAIILAKRGDMEQAKMNLNSVLEMAMKGHTPSSALVGATNANLGELYCQMGDTILAEKHLRVATSWLSLNAQENEMMRLDTAAVAAVHASLGRMCLVNGHTCEARHLLEGALNKCVGLERNPVHGKCAANLALFHLYNHNAASALALLRIARTSLRNSMGLNHIDMVACLNNLATVTDLKEVVN